MSIYLNEQLIAGAAPAPAAAMNYKGSCLQADLPTAGQNNGDYWRMADTSGKYAGQCAIWNGTESKWDYSSSNVTLDTAMSTTSTNGVENKTITAAISAATPIFTDLKARGDQPAALIEGIQIDYRNGYGRILGKFTYAEKACSAWGNMFYIWYTQTRLFKTTKEMDKILSCVSSSMNATGASNLAQIEISNTTGTYSTIKASCFKSRGTNAAQAESISFDILVKWK